MKEFDLEIRSTVKEIFTGKVLGLKAKALDGEIGILAGHAPLATVLGEGKVSYQAEGGKLSDLDIKGGFLIVENNQARVLVPEL